MYKVTFDMARINKMMKIKFGLIVHSDDTAKFKGAPIINKTHWYGTDTLKLTPNPFIILDISASSDKDEGWSPNKTVTLNRYYLFRFLQGLKKLIDSFRTCKNLFYYQNNELVVNNNLAESVSISIPTANSKTILLMPCVVPDEESSLNKVYEGCIFCINTMENYAYLTYTEMEYLMYELSKIDMNSLSLQVISIVKQYEGLQSETIKIPPSSEIPVNSEIEIVTPSKITVIKKNEMPQI